MSQRKCNISNNIAQHEAEKLSLDLCDKGRNKNEIFIEKSAILTSKHVEESQRAQLISEGDDIQETPLDFSLPKRMKINTNCPQIFSEPKTHYASSSPTLNISSQRTTPDNLYEAGSNGSKSPLNLYSEHPNTSSNLEMFANGHVVAACISPGIIQERSHSFSSLNKIRQHEISPHSHTIPSSSGIGPLSTHHLKDPALIHSVTPPAIYTADLVSQSLPVCTSPNLTGISNLTPNEVIHVYNDHIGKMSNDNCHYAFLPSGVSSCIAESFGRNGLLTSFPKVLPPVHGTTSLHHKIPPGKVTPEDSTTNTVKSLVSVKSTSPTPTVTTSATTTTAKRRPRSLPDEQKDEAYWERRRKNNEAAKRSRDARRIKEEEIALRANLLEQENKKLKSEVENLKTETAKLRVLLYEN